MNVYICEICGDAYIGTDKPSQCPFCGAKTGFIKPASEAKPIVNEKIEISEMSKKNLEETLGLEMKANAIYLCMAGKTKEYAIKAMYKRLAKVELEHAVICTKLLGITLPETKPELCSEEDVENFKKTVELEEHATSLYMEFTKSSVEPNIRKFFGALTQVESEHIVVIEKLLARYGNS